MEKRSKGLKTRPTWLKNTSIEDVEKFMDKVKVVFKRPYHILD